ncbi:hypothetical protein MG293_020789 [Ovis ammon polii]|uniref:Uncharacterized protein n=1 Tax=Ovis ammon polii TaxID=230172 RepID=A0AAD4TP80_OVIAM|nr:hypothetical protein MG293_020789 [Ovis ammon polii]KAI4549985.1 hypothetical protein MJT46_019134 [Ovis ammon polii x Ovis aries]
MWESSDTNSGYAVRSLLTKCQSCVILAFCPIYPWQPSTWQTTLQKKRRGKPSPSDLQKYVALTSVLLSGAGPSEAARTPLRRQTVRKKVVFYKARVTNPSGSGIRIELGVLTGRDLHEETSCIVPDCKPSTRCCDFIIKRSLWPHGVVLDVTSYVSHGLRSWEEYKEYSEENTAAYHFYRYEYSHALNFRFVNSFFSIKV